MNNPYGAEPFRLDLPAMHAWNLAQRHAKTAYYGDPTTEQAALRLAKATRKAAAQQRYRNRTKP